MQFWWSTSCAAAGSTNFRDRHTRSGKRAFKNTELFYQDARIVCINYEAMNELDIQSFIFSNSLLSSHSEIHFQDRSNSRFFHSDPCSREKVKGDSTRSCKADQKGDRKFCKCLSCGKFHSRNLCVFRYAECIKCCSTESITSFNNLKYLNRNKVRPDEFSILGITGHILPVRGCCEDSDACARCSAGMGLQPMKRQVQSDPTLFKRRIIPYGLPETVHMTLNNLCAKAIFQEVMNKVVSDLEGFEVYQDDLIVHGSNKIVEEVYSFGQTSSKVAALFADFPAAVSRKKSLHDSAEKCTASVIFIDESIICDPIACLEPYTRSNHLLDTIFAELSPDGHQINVSWEHLSKCPSENKNHGKILSHDLCTDLLQSMDVSVNPLLDDYFMLKEHVRFLPGSRGVPTDARPVRISLMPRQCHTLTTSALSNWSQRQKVMCDVEFAGTTSVRYVQATEVGISR
ncbi:unnamed protein product [Schistosoma mattheei]|uniref:Uncharacterized protein n=1 Tax=Schistosoma mattheei TaxID=31246 RepID=A0A183NZ39_9TREM|nr:unnamed protein product [Schistosoma mattheei]